MLRGVKRLSLCYFPGPLGSEVWHPICKQAARAEKKLKVSKLVVVPAQLLFAKGQGHCALRGSFLSVHTPQCVQVSLDFLNTNARLMGFLRGLRHWM